MAKGSKARLVAIMGIIILIMVTCSGPIADWRARNIAAPLYLPPDPATLATIQHLFESAMQMPPSAVSWQTYGFVLESKSAAGSAYLSIHEPDGRVEGKGRYLLRPESRLALVFEAPHGDTDWHTDEIAERLFFQTSALAVAVNTLPRWAVDRQGRPADVANRPDGVLVAFTLALINRRRDAVVVQLHGFEAAKRENETAALADIIVSNGTSRPSPGLISLRDCLAAIAPGRVLAYGRDVFELGGTRNAVGRAVREFGAGRFVHVEMSLPFREALLRDDSLRFEFGHCLAIGTGV